MRRRLAALTCLAVTVAFAGACSSSGGDAGSSTTSSATVTVAPSPTTTTTSVTGSSGTSGVGTTPASLSLPSGAAMVAEVTTTGGSPSGTTTVASDSAGSCGLGVLTTNEWKVNFVASSTSGDQGDNSRTVDGPKIFGLDVSAVITGGGSGTVTGEVHFTYDANALDFNRGSDRADVTVDDRGDQVVFTFSGNDDGGGTFSGTVLCGSVARNQ